MSASMASILSRELCCAHRAILQLMRLKAITHNRPFWIPKKLVFTVLTVVNAGHLRRSVEVPNKSKSIHTLCACGDLQYIVDNLRALRSRNRKTLSMPGKTQYSPALHVLACSHEKPGNQSDEHGEQYIRTNLLVGHELLFFRQANICPSQHTSRLDLRLCHIDIEPASRTR